MILVTGATGFVGQHLVNALLRKKKQVRACVRGRRYKSYSKSPLVELSLVEDLPQVASW